MGINLYAVGNSMKQTAWLFAGQGSQYIGMMQDLVEQYESARQRLHEAEQILDFPLGKICFEGPAEVLQQTRYTQPALYVHEAILVDLLSEAPRPSAVAGHSLGEYSALYAAGVFSFEDGLRLVQLRGQLMYEAGADRPGAMAAIIGLPPHIVEQICQEVAEQLQQVVVPANYNAPDQIVISGDRTAVEKAVEIFREQGAKRAILLKVSGAFHSPLMEPAKQRLAAAIQKTPMQDAQIPVYTNVSAQLVTDASQLREALIEQLTSPVLWMQTLQMMANAGITHFVEIGPGRVLQGLVRRTLLGVQSSGIDKAEHLQRFLEAVTQEVKTKEQ